MSMPEGDCEASCVVFADCVVSDCSGFGESDAEDLRLACLDACVSPAIATAFDMQETCEDKINFADGVQMGTLRPLCDSTTNRYCEVSALVCGEWPAETGCVDWYTAAAPGEADATEGASQECYKYHLNVAADLASAEEPDVAMVAAHCAHSMGMADADGNAPCTDAPELPEFCVNYAATCGEWPADAEMGCADWWAASAPGVEGDPSGASQACYSYHFGVAATMDDGSAERAAHCAHSIGGTDADGNSPCTGDEPSFCDRSTRICGDWPADAEMSCPDWWTAAAPGEAGATEGATQGCYSYHQSVAATMEGDMQAAHCAHSMGMADADGNAPCTDME
jgi:hypothetical protein